MMMSEKDVVITSPYIPIDLNFEEDNEPNYDAFTRAVAMAVDSAERGKYSYRSFYENVKVFIKKYNIPVQLFDKDLLEIDNETFSEAVALVVLNNSSKEAGLVFDNINELMDEYDIPRYRVPKAEVYGGKTLKKDWK